MSSAVGFLMSSAFPDHIKKDLLEAMVSPGCNVCTLEAEKALADMGAYHFTLPNGRRAVLEFMSSPWFGL